MNPVYVPAEGLQSWQALLAEPKKHWQPGFSAMAIADAWHHADGFPPSIDKILKSQGEPFASFRPLLIIPEHKVQLPGGSRASQNDVWVLARHNAGLASITVEGKVAESFGDSLQDWLKDASHGKRERLEFLTHTLGLTTELPTTIRYQLLHRAASALIEAERFRTNVALMIVHSFSSEDIGLSDFQAFTKLFGVESIPDEIVKLSTPLNVPLHALWVRHAVKPTA